MRLTTKIIIGIILSIFLLTLLHIIVYSFTDRRNYKRTSPERESIKIPEAGRAGIPIEPGRVVVLELDQSSEYNYYLRNEDNGLFIQPAAASGDENTLFIPESLKDCVSHQTNNDTLIVKLNMDKVREKYAAQAETPTKKVAGGSVHFQYVSGVNMYMHVSNVHVINKMHDTQVFIKNMTTDSILIQSFGKIRLESCKANVIEPYSSQITLTNCVAKSLTLDLDRLNEWKIDNCDIEKRIYTGSRRNHRITTDANDVAAITWLPKNKDAELSLIFKGEAVQIVTQAIND